MFRIGIVDLMATTARGMGAAQFTRLIGAALARPEMPGATVCVVNLDPTDTAGTRADWDTIASFDAVVVTGAEPRTRELRRDPSFALVAKILAVAAVPVMFSCLSAHAALAQLHSLSRHRLPGKRAGVFQHRVTDPLAAGLTGPVALPHSRWHTVDSAAGVIPLLVTEDGDWALAAGGDGHLFLQAHPEYFADTLFREYRRDVRRFLDRTSHSYPTVPLGYLPPDMVRALEDFSFRARRRRSPDTFQAFPDVRLDHVNWSAPAAVLIANWLSGVFGVVNV